MVDALTLKNLLRKCRGVLRIGKKDSTSQLINLINEDYLLGSNELLRLGTKYGGWLLPKNVSLDQNSVCYLAGAGEDISFDCDLAEKFECKVLIIDPTPRAIAHFQHLSNAVNKGEKFPINGSRELFYKIDHNKFSKIQFLPYGLAGEDVEMKFFMPKDPSHVSCSTLNLQQTNTWFTAQCFRLLTLMHDQGDHSIDLLKMDIEGGEYAVIDNFVVEGPLPSLLLIEFDEAHTPLDDDALSRIQNRIESLQKVGMRCIAVEGCNMTFQRQI